MPESSDFDTCAEDTDGHTSEAVKETDPEKFLIVLKNQRADSSQFNTAVKLKTINKVMAGITVVKKVSK